MLGLLERLTSIGSFSFLMFLIVLVVFNYDQNKNNNYNQTPTASFNVTQPPTIKYSLNFGYEESSIKFNYTADLSSLASWNVKSFYIYILVTLKEDGKTLLQTILHDYSLVNNYNSYPDKSLTINSTNQMCRFSVKDKHLKLLGATVKITSYCIKHRSVGFTQKFKLSEVDYKMPSKYSYDEAQLHKKYYGYKKPQ